MADLNFSIHSFGWLLGGLRQNNSLGKFGLILIAVLLYYAISTQPTENLVWISVVFFCLGVGVSFYFFLTHDFVTAPRKLEFVNSVGRWVMGIRPRFEWMPMQPNYVAGIVAITTPFIFYPVRKFSNRMNWWGAYGLSLAQILYVQPHRMRNFSFYRNYYPIFGILIFALTGILLANLHKLQSIWYADLGAVEMDRVELAGFPTGK